MDNNLRIRLSATLNSGKAIKDINEAIKGIQKHPSLQKIDLKLNIDKNFTQSINQFVAAANKLKKVSDEQNKVVGETIEIYKQLDGSIKQVTTSQKANGEVVTKTRIKHDENTASMNAESASAKELAKAMESVNDANRDSIAITKNKKGLATNIQVKTSEGYTTTTESLNGKGELQRTTEVTNYKREREDIAKAQKEANAKELALDKAHYQALQMNREKDLAKFKQIAAEKAKVEDLMRRFGSDSNVKDQLSNIMSGLDKDSEKIKRKLAEGWGIKEADLQSYVSMDTQLKNITASAKTAKSNAMGLGEQLGEAFKKFPVWMIATTAFYGSIRAINSAVTTIVEIDSKMTELRRVMSDSTDFDKMLRNSIDLSNQLGRSLNDTLDAMGQFAKQGFNEIESEELAKTALLMQNISDMSSDEAVDALTSAMISFNIEASKSIQIADKINEVDNQFSITSQTLATSLQRAGSAAATFGVGIDEMLGHVTAIGSVTRESGSVIGKHKVAA